MTNQIQNSNVKTARRSAVEKRETFDLEERTAEFGERIIRLAKAIKPNEVTRPLISQLIRAGTSIGANYCEANDAQSKKDFRHKIALCRKESHETKYWLRMIATADSTSAATARELWKEAKELNLIFGSICRRTDK
jgi:four helix bundle protein